MDPQSDKARILGMIRKERDALDALVASLSEAQMLEPGLGEGRSVKVMLLHVAGGERRFVGWLAAAERGETPALPTAAESLVAEANWPAEPAWSLAAARGESEAAFAAF